MRTYILILSTRFVSLDYFLINLRKYYLTLKPKLKVKLITSLIVRFFMLQGTLVSSVLSTHPASLLLMIFKSLISSKRFHYFLKKFCATILAIIFWDILMFDKIFVSPQVKWIVIISNKHCINELPHELPNDLRLKT